MKPNYYNELNPEAAAWLRELIRVGVIAPGEVDERSITKITYDELKRFNQCHFFAGIGGWSLALRLAHWPDDKPVWTGSCPCQPFSQAGKRQVDSDERHLWPAFRAAIAECRPAIVFGEQVAGKDGRIWLAGVRSDLETLGYAVGAADLCAAGVSAPHIRQRLYWVANPLHGEQRRPTQQVEDESHHHRMGNADGTRSQGRNGTKLPERAGERIAWSHGSCSRLVNADGYHSHWWSGPLQVGRNSCEAEIERGGRKYRAQWRIKPGLSLLADGIPHRVGLLRGYGNAIVPQLAAEFIQASQEGMKNQSRPLPQNDARGRDE